MLIRLSCKNYKSIGLEPVQLEMVSSSKVRLHPSHVCSGSGGSKILRNAVIYGGNAAGKSNLVSALRFIQAAVLGGAIPQSAFRDYCRCEEGLENKESVFDIQFQIAEKTFDYGFSCILSKLEITSEWLYLLGKSKPTQVFRRNGAKNVELGKAFQSSLSKRDRARLDIYKDDFLHNASLGMVNSLFLTAIALGKSFEPNTSAVAFQLTFDWFYSCLNVAGARMHASRVEYYADDESLDAVAEVLASFDTGVNNLRKMPVSMDELEKQVPLDIIMTIREILKDNQPRSKDDKFVLTVRNDNIFLGVERTGVDEPLTTILKIGHSGSLLDFDFRDESDGTRRLFDLMDLLFTKREDAVFVIDELNRYFHPLLTQHFVSLFNRVHADDNCQLVFTTHENDIMSYDYFRRDEIWFVDRDEHGFSNLYPLDDFAGDDVRSDTRLNKQYLEGRYGGVPVLSMSRALAALKVGEL